ncbi:MAG: carboxypeptidase-like regulatory domain-containing protein, partial [Gemmatimonadota bacterium]|nr:carboxypeptidase-like regulatory domain-containing protein [Gemmatimonadota bacterium]
MSSLSKFWRIPAFLVALALPLAVACADDEGATPPGQDPTPTTGTISGTVTNAADGSPIVGALVGTSPATTTALTDAQGNYSITNIPIPSSGSASFAVTASKEDFTSNSTSVTLSASSPTATANIQLSQPAQPTPPTTGNLNVLVTNRNGDAMSDASVTVNDAGGNEVATASTDANGFALFSDLDAGAYTVTATKTISGIAFQASGGANVDAGETAFLQLTLSRDFDQSVFPNIDGESITLGDGSDIDLVPVPGGDSNPEVDCNIIRTQHMFIAEVRNEDGDLVSGVKVNWDLNISENGTVTVTCPELTDDPAGCKIPTVPGNTGSIVDTDDPDLDPSTARSGLNPAYKVDSRHAVTFTNDNAQTVAFGGSNVSVGAGQTWIVITSPVEGLTDVIASTPDIPINDPNCAIDNPNACDKEFAIKRWVNWDTSVYEVTWPDQNGDVDGWQPGPTRDIYDASGADFNEISNGGTIVNILNRRTGDPEDEDDQPGLNESYTDQYGCTDADWDGQRPPVEGACELITNRTLFLSEVKRLRNDSPFNLSRGIMRWRVTDDVPNLDFWGEDPGNDGDGCDNGVCNAEHNGPSDDQYWINGRTPGNLITDRDQAWVEFDANNNAFDGGVITQNPLCSAPCDEDDFI